MDSRLAMILLCGALAGCGTTKWTDTSRSATEQLLITDAMDRAVSRLDLRSLAGKTVYLDSTPVTGLTDSAYLISSLRQHLLASGCVVKESKQEANYVLEIRAGAIGTDHHDLTFGVPRVDVPAILPVSGFGIPTNIPELPLAKRTHQRAVTKIAVFAYNRETGRPVWQSGVIPMESGAKAIWLFGAGPFQRGSIFEGTSFAGDTLKIPMVDLGNQDGGIDSVSVAEEAYFIEPKKGSGNLVQESEGAAQGDGSGPSQAGETAASAEAPTEVVRTGHTEPSDGVAGAEASPADSFPADPPSAQPAPTGEPPSPAPSPGSQPY